MKDRHVINVIEEGRFADLGEAQLSLIGTHAQDCDECRNAFAAARISNELLRVRAEMESPTPSPFFQTKVMAALRERQAIRKPIAAFRRWWQAAYPMVGSMLILAVILAALTIVAPRHDATQAGSTPSYNLYTTDEMMLNQRPRNLTTEQALEVIYTERRDATKK